MCKLKVCLLHCFWHSQQPIHDHYQSPCDMSVPVMPLKHIGTVCMVHTWALSKRSGDRTKPKYLQQRRGLTGDPVGQGSIKCSPFSSTLIRWNRWHTNIWECDNMCWSWEYVQHPVHMGQQHDVQKQNCNIPKGTQSIHEYIFQAVHITASHPRWKKHLQDLPLWNQVENTTEFKRFQKQLMANSWADGVNVVPGALRVAEPRNRPENSKSMERVIAIAAHVMTK